MKKEMKPKTKSFNILLIFFITCIILLLIFIVIPNARINGYGIAAPPNGNGDNGGVTPEPGPEAEPNGGSGGSGPSLEEPGLIAPGEIGFVAPVACGNGICEPGESYDSCFIDCCGAEGDHVFSPYHCCPGLKAISPCYPGLPCLSTGWYCMNCGDGKCSGAENPFNCPEDCGPICGNKICEPNENNINCPIDCAALCGNDICEPPIETSSNCNQDCCGEAGSAIGPPHNCCEGLKLVDYVPPGGKGVPISIKYCVDCGNHLCEEYETITNCPEDCEEEINCEDLPPISSSIEYDKGQQTIILNWRYAQGMNIKNQYIYEASRCKTTPEQQEPVCDWDLTAPRPIDSSIRTWGESISNIDSRLKFYRLGAVIEFGCKPICLFEGSESEGWYDSCTGELIKYAECSDMYAVCDKIGSKSEGWYTRTIKPVGTAGELIVWDQCSKKIKECNMKSDIMLVFGQEIEKIPREGAATSINFVINLLGPVESNNLLAEANADYVARWKCSTQSFTGTAYGMGGRGVTTGIFEMTPGYPYSVSATQNIRLIWAAKLPDHIIFDFCQQRNYMSLPLDTKLEMASDVCDSLGLGGGDFFGYWDVQEQEPVVRTCNEIKYTPGENFEVEPGGIYYFYSTESKRWTQE